jgi:hypothetical protein
MVQSLMGKLVLLRNWIPVMPFSRADFTLKQLQAKRDLGQLAAMM